MHALRVTVASALLVAGLAGCGQQAVDKLSVGDCFNYSELGSEVSSVPSIDCAEPHEAEVFAVFDISLPAFDDQAVTDAADQGCYDAFAGYIGIDYVDSQYYYYALTPLADGWANGDRGVICFVVPESGTVTGSLKGSAA